MLRAELMKHTHLPNISSTWCHDIVSYLTNINNELYKIRPWSWTYKIVITASIKCLNADNAVLWVANHYLHDMLRMRQTDRSKFIELSQWKKSSLNKKNQWWNKIMIHELIWREKMMALMLCTDSMIMTFILAEQVK